MRTASEFLTIGDVCRRYSASREWVRRRIHDADFPQPVRFGPGALATRRWRRVDLEAWEAEREQVAL